MTVILLDGTILRCGEIGFLDIWDYNEFVLNYKAVTI